MKRCLSIGATLLLGSAATFGYTNILENGIVQTVTNAWDAGGDIVVGNLTPTNRLNIAAGGAVSSVNGYVGFAASASSNAIDVSGAGSHWYSAGLLQIGSANTNSDNRVAVANGGRITLDSLVIYNGNRLDVNDGGTLAVSGSFNIAPQSNLHWNDGGTLSIGGDLTGMTVENIPGIGNSVYISGRGRGLTIDGGEDIAKHVPMVSRILHLLVIDILSVGVAMRRGNAADSEAGSALARGANAPPASAVHVKSRAPASRAAQPVARRVGMGISSAGQLASLTPHSR